MTEKKEYKTPTALCDSDDPSFFPAVALVGAYALARGVTKAMDIRALKKQPVLSISEEALCLTI